MGVKVRCHNGWNFGCGRLAGETRFTGAKAPLILLRVTVVGGGWSDFGRVLLAIVKQAYASAKR